MPELLSFSVEDGDVLIAVRSPEDAVRPVGVIGDAVKSVSTSLEEAFQTVNKIAQCFKKSILKSGEAVDRAELEIGFQFTAKGSIYVVESEGQASFKVKLFFGSSE